MAQSSREAIENGAKNPKGYNISAIINKIANIIQIVGELKLKNIAKSEINFLALQLPPTMNLEYA